MSGPAAFKEKTFEKYFGFELARLTNITFSPDQCDERFIGFDDAFLLPWHFLRHNLPYMRNSRRRRQHGISLKEFDFHASKLSERLPDFKFNLFVQYKRPAYVDHFNGKEWSYWGNPYFRFDVTPHQQKILAAMEAQSHGRASVIYASAAFWTNEDLYRFSAAEEIVANTNISNVALLVGHGRYTYDKPGTFGIGHSEPEPIASTSIYQILERGQGQKGLTFTAHIKRAAADMKRALENEPQLMATVEQVRSANFGNLFDELQDSDAESFLYALSTVEAFSEVFDVTFYAMA
jgi:hypothetical protein